MNKRYLGDGVYATFDGYHIVLTTDNGIFATNTIFLEDVVFQNLREFGEQCFNPPADQRDKSEATT